MTLEVLICTYGNEGLNRVAKMNLPTVEGVQYLVSWQTDEFNLILPDELHREDLVIYTTRTKGLSVNRNHALKKASCDICLIADDDLIYTVEQLQAIIETFEKNPSVDIALFRYSGGNNKRYPNQEFDIQKKPKGYYISSIEIAFRRNSLPPTSQFDTNFGVGTAMPAGEEFIFIHQAMKLGLKCHFFPITITHHEGLSTGSRQYTDGILQANGACLAIGYGLLGVLRIPIMAWRISRQGKAKIFPAVQHLFKGYIYGNKNF